MDEGNKSAPPETHRTLSISPEILAKFSTGEIQLGEGMMIKGEGKERKITITLTPNDPLYLEYLEELESSAKLTRNIIQVIGDSEYQNEMIRLALNMRKAKKERLNQRALDRGVNKYTDDRMQEFLRRNASMTGAESERKQLLSDATNFNDLAQYITHLTAKKAFEAILPEQQMQQGTAQN